MDNSKTQAILGIRQKKKKEGKKKESNTIPQKEPRGDPRCSIIVNLFCFLKDTRRVTPCHAQNNSIGDRGKKIPTKIGKDPLSYMDSIFRSDQPVLYDDRKSFVAMTSKLEHCFLVLV